VAQYIAHFRNVVMPRYSSLFANEVYYSYIWHNIIMTCLT
jgi:hypothetical protein